jgi:hypothetical protein
VGCLDDLTPGAELKGIHADGPVEVVDVSTRALEPGHAA